jgi:hypothetical protein
MLSLFQIWSSFQSFVNTFQGGWYRPQTDFENAVNDISKLLWEDWTGQAEKSQEIKDHLASFLISNNLVVKSANSFYGTVAYPSSYGRFATARILVAGDGCIPCKTVDSGKCANDADFKTEQELTDEYYDTAKEREVLLIDTQRWASCLNHLTKCPTFENPKMLQTDTGFNVAPRKVSVVVLSFYKRPKDGTFRYTVASGNIQTGAGDQIVYNANQSTPLEWPDTVLNEFVIRLGERFGLFTRDQFVTLVSGQMKKTA